MIPRSASADLVGALGFGSTFWSMERVDMKYMK
jgi:hypothetical protein